MTNMIDLQNMPRLRNGEKATYGVPCIVTFTRSNHDYLSFWDGQEWRDYGVEDGNLVAPHDDWVDIMSAPL